MYIQQLYSKYICSKIQTISKKQMGGVDQFNFGKACLDVQENIIENIIYNDNLNEKDVKSFIRAFPVPSPRIKFFGDLYNVTATVYGNLYDIPNLTGKPKRKQKLFEVFDDILPGYHEEGQPEDPNIEIKTIKEYLPYIKHGDILLEDNIPDDSDGYEDDKIWEKNIYLYNANAANAAKDEVGVKDKIFVNVGKLDVGTKVLKTKIEIPQEFAIGPNNFTVTYWKYALILHIYDHYYDKDFKTVHIQMHVPVQDNAIFNLTNENIMYTRNYNPYCKYKEVSNTDLKNDYSFQKFKLKIPKNESKPDENLKPEIKYYLVKNHPLILYSTNKLKRKPKSQTTTNPES